MKKSILFFCFSFISLLLAGCTDEAPTEFDLSQLTRVDTEITKTDGTIQAEVIVSEEELLALREVFGEIKWAPGAMVDGQGDSSVKAVLFYTYDQNMPERLFEYEMWFHKDGTASIQSNNEKEGAGTLGKEQAQTLKKVLLN